MVRPVPESGMSPSIISVMTDLPDTRALVEAAKPLPSIGREAIRAKLEHCEPQEIVEASGLLAVPSPVFVTLRILGELRGCIGSLRPLCANLVEETKDRACAAAFEDPRFPPLTLPELEQTDVEVSILGPLETVDSPEELDPARFGIEVSDGRGRRGVLLPEIAGVEKVAQQIELARQKAQIPRGTDLEIRRFSVVKVQG